MSKCQRYVQYRVTVRNKSGTIVAPFINRKNAVAFVKAFKRTNPHSKSKFKIRKTIVPANRLSKLEKKAFKCGV